MRRIQNTRDHVPLRAPMAATSAVRPGQSVAAPGIQGIAVAEYAELELSFPVASWPQAWAQISAIACAALDVLREKAHAGLGGT